MWCVNWLQRLLLWIIYQSIWKKTFLLEKTDWVFIINRDKGDWVPQPEEEADNLFPAIYESIKTQKPHHCGF